MNNNLFKVVFTGQINNPENIDQAIEKIVKIFKIPTEKAAKIIGAKREVVLTKKLEHVKAYRLKTLLEEIGMEIRLEQAALVEPPKVIQEKEAEPTEVSTSTEPTQNAAWSLEEVTPQKEHETEPQVEEHTQINNSNTEETSLQNNTTITTEDNSLMGKIKSLGGIIVGLGAGALLLLKKFGLFKLLKIGILVGAASAIGFDGEEACMGNSQCEDAVQDQMDDCWEKNGFDDIDWDKISEQEYITLKPKIENEFIGCFKYENTNERIFVSPIDLRFDLMDFCESSEIKNCNEIVEPQIKSCYQESKLNQYFTEETTDYYGVFEQHPQALTRFYTCFVDENGQQLMGYDLND